MVRIGITLGLCLLAVGSLPAGAAAVAPLPPVAGSADTVEPAVADPAPPNRTVVDLRAVFERQYGDRGVTSAVAVTRVSDGEFLLAGSRVSVGSGDEDAWLVRLNRSGEAEWSRAYGGEGDSWADAVTASDDGGAVFAGSTGSSDETGNAWLVEVNATGAVEWERSYNRSHADSANAVVRTTDGGFLFGGTTNATDGTDDAWLVKTNATGAVEWERTYSRSGDEWINGVVETTDGYVFAGFTRTAFDPGDAWLVKVNATGTVEWDRTYGGSQEEEINELRRTDDGGYLLAGGSNRSDGGIDGWIVKVNDTGTVGWTGTYGRDGVDIIHSVVGTDDGAYLATGLSNSYGSSPDAWVLRISASGEPEITKTYGGGLVDWGNGVVKTGDEFLIAGGADRAFGIGNASAIRVKPVFRSRVPADDPRRQSSTPEPDSSTGTSPTPTPTPTAPTPAGTPTATATPTPTATPSGAAAVSPGTTISSEGPGFGGIAALVALVATAFLALRRLRRRG